MGRTQPSPTSCDCSAARICATGVSEESVRWDVRTTLPVTAARLLDGISTGVPVTRGPVSCDLAGASPLNRELRPSNGLNWGMRRSATGACFRPISAIALHRDSVIAETAFPQGRMLGERRRNRGRSPSERSILSVQNAPSDYLLDNSVFPG